MSEYIASRISSWSLTSTVCTFILVGFFFSYMWNAYTLFIIGSSYRYSVVGSCVPMYSPHLCHLHPPRLDWCFLMIGVRVMMNCLFWSFSISGIFWSICDRLSHTP